MKKKVLISSFDMEVGGVERSLISMLNNFDYDNHEVNLLLYSHTGDFMNLLPKESNLLKEIPKYKTFRMSISNTLKAKYINLAWTRLYAKYKSRKIGKKLNIEEPGYIQMQYMWKYALPFLPKLEQEYDVAISFLWPHYFIAEKVKAKTKIAWIHTDYSILETDIQMDLKMWNEFDYIISISEDVTRSFLLKYPTLKNKIVVVENITSPQFVQDMANDVIYDFSKEKDQFNLVSVGRLCHAKGYDHAVKALKLLHEKGLTQIKWYIVGYGGDKEMLKGLIRDNQLEDSVILLGKKTNPYPYIKQCDVYVQPSRYEGKAVTVTEAKILGKPVIITDYETAKSQLVDGFDGYITELSVEGIADGIEKLYDDKIFRDMLATNCSKTDYGNQEELQKLYELF